MSHKSPAFPYLVIYVNVIRTYRCVNRLIVNFCHLSEEGRQVCSENHLINRRVLKEVCVQNKC